MTYDDGVIGVYELTQEKVPGKKPTEGLQEKERFAFSYETLGINRYYTALQADQQIESVIRIPGWVMIPANRHIAVLADVDGNITGECDQFRIVMVQPTTDEDGLQITRLSLERLGENYAVFS